MDQLRNILGLLKKHHFWLLAVICMISGLVGWSMASKSLSAAYKQKKGNIEKAFRGLKEISDTNPFPNSTWKDEVAKLKEREQQLVDKAAAELYDQQKQILNWPDWLGSKFLTDIQKIAPGAEIPEDDCLLYATNINEENKAVEHLLAIIRATPGAQAADAPGARAPPKERDDSGAPRVVWDDQSQVPLLLNWKGATPQPAKVWLTQEDLWVYASVLRIIGKINGEEFVLRIPRIESLTIGAKAATALERGMGPGHIEVAAQAASGTGDGIQQGGGGAGPAASSDAEAAPAPDEGRYVDANGKPMAGGGAAKEPFKRMPVYLKLSIDQREILKLLVECANSPLPIEVRQLRIGSGSGKNAANSSKVNENAGGGAGGANAEAESHNRPLELGGIIYIYNKPVSSQPAGDQPPATAAAPATGATDG